jgi:transposase
VSNSERGADRAAAVRILIMTPQLDDVDPLAWLADVLARIADTPQNRLPDLLQWEWKRSHLRAAV